MNLIPFHPNHLLFIDFVEEENSFYDGVKDSSIRRQWYHPALSYTVVDGGKPQASFGILPLWEGRGLIWIIFDKNIGPRRFLKTVLRGRELLDNVMDAGFYRIEAYVNPDYRPAIRFAELAGFEKEGVMRNLDGKRDFHLYSKVK